MTDEYHLQRFITAQAPLYNEAIGMLRHGMMCTPYVDFIFPRLAVGETLSKDYALPSLDAAAAYLAHPTLGARYRECVETLSKLVDSLRD